MTRVAVNPALLCLARDELSGKFKKPTEWESCQTQPTLKQVEVFAREVHVPVGYLFLTEPLEETVPIPDFRTFAGKPVSRLVPNLKDTICVCRER